MTTSDKKKHKQARSILILVLLVVAVSTAIGIYFYITSKPVGTGNQEQRVAGKQAPSPSEGPDFEVLLGRWRRPDGGYIIEIRDMDTDGRMDAAYFNPRPINVSQAQVSREGSDLKVFIELQDQGYPGATYKLIYYPKQNILAGLYHQPAAGGTFEVYFQRAD